MVKSTSFFADQPLNFPGKSLVYTSIEMGQLIRLQNQNRAHKAKRVAPFPDSPFYFMIQDIFMALHYRGIMHPANLNIITSFSEGLTGSNSGAISC
ncbi:hypothetical protein DC20_05895 [Rufibacter tibetensis]|uniref:Uncharacterized protein n=1 Tax=Rufibacter tibetensis TaxID=512763 RepID=A0A0P0C5P8_9BACT|nr:hypothetical protein DC20_05895 [Rufibacter tibetensis]